MNPDQIEQMAREAGFDVSPAGIFNPDTVDEKPLDAYLARFAQAVRAAALEEAAKAVEAEALLETPLWEDDRGYNMAIGHCATAIRALAQQAGGEQGGEK